MFHHRMLPASNVERLRRSAEVGELVDNGISFAKDDAGQVTAIEIREFAHFTK